MGVDSLLCKDNGKWQDGGCVCFPCYTGLLCSQVVSSECKGTIQQPKGIEIVQKCKCNYNQAGHCCEKKKCAGSNPTPDLETGECDCADPELRSGEFCEKVKCQNGVTAVKRGDCDCSGSRFSGEYCERISCYNNGNPYANATKCRCGDRYYGDHCEHYKRDDAGLQNNSKPTDIDCGLFNRGDNCDEINILNLAIVLVPVACLVIVLTYCIHKKVSSKPAAPPAPVGPDMHSRALRSDPDRVPLTATAPFINPTSIHRGSSERLASGPDRGTEQIGGNWVNSTGAPGNADPRVNDDPANPFLGPTQSQDYPDNVSGGTSRDHPPMACQDEPPPYELVVQTNYKGGAV